MGISKSEEDIEFTLRIARGAAALTFAQTIMDACDLWSAQSDRIHDELMQRSHLLNDSFAASVRSAVRQLRTSLQGLEMPSNDELDDDE